MIKKKSAARKAAPAKAGTKKAAPKKWSKSVTEHSNAMDLEKDIFKSKNPKPDEPEPKRKNSIFPLLWNYLLKDIAKR